MLIKRVILIAAFVALANAGWWSDLVGTVDTEQKKRIERNKKVAEAGRKGKRVSNKKPSEGAAVVKNEKTETKDLV